MKSEKYASALRLCMTALLLAIVLGAEAVPVAQVIWCQGNKTLYFTYEELKKVGGTYDGRTITEVWSGSDVTASNADYTWALNTYEENDPKDCCTTVVFNSSFSDVRPTSCAYWFLSFYYLTTITGLDYLNTSDVTTMQSMFSNCYALTSLDLSNFDTSKVTNMETMFYNCKKLVSIDLTSFDTSSVTGMYQMFNGCANLASLSVGSGWTMDNVGKWSEMFDGCSSLSNLQVNDESNCTKLVGALNEKTLNITLQGRTLHKDGNWNTLCLPFTIALESSPFEGATAMTLDASSSGFDSQSGLLTLNFNTATGTIDAGTPFIVKWTSGSSFTPTFANVKIDNSSPAKERMTATTDDGNVQFIGTYAPAALEANTTANLYLGDDNKLFYPTTDGFKVNAFRAWFQVGLASGGGVRSFVLNFDDNEVNGIEKVTTPLSPAGGADEAVYDLQGRRMEPSIFNVQSSILKKGVYIKNGRKFVIKH